VINLSLTLCGELALIISDYVPLAECSTPLLRASSNTDVSDDIGNVVSWEAEAARIYAQRIREPDVKVVVRVTIYRLV
jgi:hypothetical protein